MRTCKRSSDQGGFALAMVVMLLFVIGVAGATGFQMVSNEFALATQNRDGQEALIIARAGLQRFLGENVGQVGDGVTYAIGNGLAMITTRRLMSRDSLTHLYYIRSEGSVADVRTPLLAATRAVGTYAWHHQNPIPPKSAMLLSGGVSTVYNGNVSGEDAAPTVCYGNAGGVGGIGTAGSVTISTAAGNTGAVIAGKGEVAIYTKYPDYASVYDTVGIRWDILTDPAFPVDFNGMPDNATFAELPAESYPIVRINGDYTTSWMSNPAGLNGRGVLIVPGNLILWGNFNWKGIILAGNFNEAKGDDTYFPTISGLFIGGLNSSNAKSDLTRGNFYYNSCDAYKANKSLSYLEVVRNTLFEINGQ